MMTRLCCCVFFKTLNRQLICTVFFFLKRFGKWVYNLTELKNKSSCLTPETQTLLRSLHVAGSHQSLAHIHANSHKSLSPLCLPANETCRLRHDPSEYRQAQKQKRTETQSLFILLRAHANQATCTFSETKWTLAFLPWDMGLFLSSLPHLCMYYVGPPWVDVMVNGLALI